MGNDNSVHLNQFLSVVVGMANESTNPLHHLLDVGNNVTQLLKRENRYLEDHRLDKYMLVYLVGLTPSVGQYFETKFDKDGVRQLVRFKFSYHGSITIFIERADNNLLKPINTNDFVKDGVLYFVNETMDRLGEVTKTNVAYRGTEEEGCLLVVEQKRKSGAEKPYIVTLAHYYAISSTTFFGLITYDAGLSMIVNVRVFNNELDFVFSYSNNHSSRALLPMFQQVCRTRTWKWDTCPYNDAENRRKQFRIMNRHLFKTNTETDIETDDEEGSYVQLTKQIGSNILANQGAIRGKNNGNMVVKNLYLRGRK